MLTILKESINTLYEYDETYSGLYHSHIDIINYLERNDDCSVDWVNRKLQEILNDLIKHVFIDESEYVELNNIISLYLIKYYMDKPTDE